ncbi:beta strand repeat-containing protein [Enterococcus rivorum]|uniref:beta strand repeat-containing protein n=1 Tax=Enterococcus rivorum TaxID=762845 RepID=UPI000B1144A4|nr:hypothetical protein [Enterococcus rivorum]MBP2099132.1 hypothetical protein [Enterococcus rivorum]
MKTKKLSLVLLPIFLVGIGYFVFSNKPIQASEDQDTSTFSSVDIQNKENLEESKVQNIQLPLNSEPISNSNDEITSEEKEKNDVTFVLPEGYQFADGSNSTTVSVESGQKLTDEMLPVVEIDAQTQRFEGWSLNGEILTKEQLLKMNVSEGILLTAVVKTKVSGRAAKSLNTSIQPIIAGADQSKLIVIPDPSGGGANYKEYASTDAGMKTALADLYANGNGGEFVMYIGTNFTAATATTAKVIPASVTAANATFYALQGKVSSLVLTGHATDPINNNTTAVSGQKTLTLQGAFHLGTNLAIRNLNYNGSNLFMNGNSLDLNGGSYGNGWNVYGGSDTTDVTGSPTITINSTGSGTWTFYGGSSNGGTLTGNASVIMNNTSGNINTVSGGAYLGTINGNASLTINNTSGTVSNIYAAGQGTGTSATANVTGNVNTVVNAPSGTGLQLDTVRGGVRYGKISGTITTTLSGYGRWTGLSGQFTGGSEYGDIGSDKSKTAITTNFDTSNFTSGRTLFEGGNRYRGIITGSIDSQVKAGAYNKGSVQSVSGAGGYNIDTLSQASIGAGNTTTYDAYSPEQRANIAENAATFRVYGDVSTKIISGVVSDDTDFGYTRAAGFGGYIAGNTTVTVGTLNTDGTTGGAGLAYSQATSPTNDFSYSTTAKSRGYVTGWDIVGGGGTPGGLWRIYIKGDTKTVVNNAVARWTYGGSFSGVTEGNTSHTLNAGILDTLEGAGYDGQRVFGNSQATVNNGQVDWFLSGGGWDDDKIVGNVGVSVYEGFINASMGASYGASGGHVITGNSNNIIYGGNFSGTPRAGNNAFSGGITNNGTLQGNANLTIDLRNYNGEFKLPTGTSISGGVPYNVGTNLGTDTNNTITLNIYTKPGTDALNGANIYGDGGSTAGNTKSGKIIMNIDAPGSSIGNLYATNYSNISSGKLLRDVSANVQRAASINGISGGSSGDNFTTAIATASTNNAKFTFGASVRSNENQTAPIDVTGTGVVNFTNLIVKNQTVVTASGGNILNGRSATAANHGATYSGFGDILLTEGSGIGVSTATNYISGGALTIQGESKIISAPGTGKINISDFIIPDKEVDRLTWIKTTSNDSAAMVASTGTWFGSNSAYQVLTINPTAANAAKVTPIVFKGIEQSTGKTFIGDSDTTKGANGYGIAIPGSTIDYEVTNPVKDGTGDIKHNVSQVKVNNTPLTLAVWGSEVAGTPVQKGRLVIPTSSGVLPTLTFTPETATTGSWLYNATIATTKVGTTDNVIPQQTNSNPVNWKSPSGDYSYTVKVRYSNQVELSVRNVILKESEAALVANKTDVNHYTEVKGRPFLTDDIDENKITDIKKPISAGQVSRMVQVNYTAGTTAANKLSKTANIIIVKDTASVSTNRYVAVYAEDAELKLEQANGLTNQQALESQYTKAVAILAEGIQRSPDSDVATFTEIKNTTSDQLPKSVGIDYSYSSNGDTASKKITVQVVGILEILEVPTSMEFGEQVISNKEQTVWPTINGNLTVSDTRGSGRQPWSMRVKELTPLTNGTYTLASALKYLDGGVEQTISSSDIVIETYSPTADGTRVLTDSWGETKNKGIKLVVPVKNQRIGSYSGTLSWSLVDAPGND